jgi:hypothetical protein
MSKSFFPSKNAPDTSKEAKTKPLTLAMWIIIRMAEIAGVGAYVSA